MARPPDFDPYELLGVDASADDATIDRAYKARIRYVHPDIAGATGLDETKRLNVAREWLLDPELRAQLPPPKRTWRQVWSEWRTSATTDGASSGADPWATSAPGGWQPPGHGPGQPPGQGPGQGVGQPPGRGSGAWPGQGGGPASDAPPRPSSDTEWYWAGKAEPPPRPTWDYDPEFDDPLEFDFGTATNELHAFFETIRSLTVDERARVTYSLGDEPPVPFDQFEDVVGEELWARSRALEDAVAVVWAERVDESRPLTFPRGRVFGHGAVVANTYAQWILLGERLRSTIPDAKGVAATEARCMAPWVASVGHARYGDAQREVVSFLDDARVLPLKPAERMARSWERHMGGFLYGRPGEDWFPGAPRRPDPALVSARLAAVDASRIEPPAGLASERVNAFRCGLRLTAYVLALGDASEPGRDYLRPWRDATDESPSFIDRARWGMPKG